MKMDNILLFFLLLLLHSTITLSQSPADAPAPPGPTNVTKILEKAGQFTTLIRLLKATGESDRLISELNNSNNGMTIFAPSDNAFSNLKAGTLNALASQQQSELVQFHMIPSFISSQGFQTVSNPLRTEAGDSGDDHFPLNVTTTGNTVNLTSGLTNTSISGTVYSDGQVAVYQIDQVLKPVQVFDPRPPAPAPAPAKTEKKRKKVANEPSDSADVAGAVTLTSSMHKVALLGLTCVFAGFYL